MDLERYPVESYDENTYFEFFSEGVNGSIKKIVEYTKIEKGLFNLAFGDWDATYPDAYIYIEGGTPAKTRLYQMNINKKYWQEINSSYIVFANYNGIWELFQQGKNYKAFAVGKR